MEQRTRRHQRCSGPIMNPDKEMEHNIVSSNVTEEASSVIMDAHLKNIGELFPCVSPDRCRAPLLESEILKRSLFLLDCRMWSSLKEEDARR